MDNRAEQQNKYCELDDLRNLDKLGFKLISLKQDPKTPNIQSTNDIYNIPYWASNSRRGIRE